MATWDEYLTDVDDPDLDPGLSGDIRDLQADVGAAETQAILAGDVDAADSLAAQWQSLEETADHTESAEQDVEWSQQSAAEAETAAEDAAKEASYATEDDPRFTETAAKDAYQAEIAGESSAASLEEAGGEYEAAAESLDTGLSDDFGDIDTDTDTGTDY